MTKLAKSHNSICSCNSLPQNHMNYARQSKLKTQLLPFLFCLHLRGMGSTMSKVNKERHSNVVTMVCNIMVT